MLVGLQILLAFAVGGFVFSERSSNIVRERLQRYQIADQAEAAAKIDRVEARVREIVERAEKIAEGATLRSLPWDLIEVYGIFRDLYQTMLNQLPNVYVASMRIRIATTSPGGLFGLFSFTVFWLFTACAVVKMYFDYAPKAC